MGRAANYYTHREGEDKGDRTWRTADGQAVEYLEARERIREGARTHGYSYRMVLSTKEADIGAEGYREVLGDRFKHYLFIEHHNTDFPHAHVIAWTSKVLSRAELGAMREQLLSLEQAKAREQGQHISTPEPQRDLWQEIGIPQGSKQKDLDIDI